MKSIITLKKNYLVVFFFVFTLFSSQNTFAAARSWGGTAGAGNWACTLSTCWSPTGAPASGDAITVSKAMTFTNVNCGSTLGSLSITSSTSLSHTSAYTLSTNALTISSGVTLTLASSNITLNCPAGQTWTVGAGTLAIGSGKLTISGTVNISGPFTNSGTITVLSGGLLNFTNNPSVPTGITVNSGGEIRFSGSGAATGGTITCNGIMRFAGTSSTSSGSFLVNWPAGTTSKLIYSGTSAQTAYSNEINGTSSTYPYNIEIANASGVTFSTGSYKPSYPTIAGSLILTSGKLTIAELMANITFTGNTPISRTSGTLDASGTYAILTFASTSGNAAAIPSGTFANTSIYQITVNMTTASATVTLNDQNLSIATCVLTKGLLVLGSASVNVASFSGSSTFSATNMVVTPAGSGLLTHTFGATGAFTYPLGDNVNPNEYSRADFTLNSYTGTPTIGFAAVDANDPNIAKPSTPANYTSRYWRTSVSGATAYNYGLNLFYTGTVSDVTGTEASLAPYLYNGSTAWIDLGGSVNTTNHNLVITGETESTGPFGQDIMGRTATCTALSGTYTIGGATPSYATFAAAVSALANCGVSGPVIFNVRNGTYTEQLIIPAITGASATNTITFQSETANPDNVILQTNVNASGTNYVVQLNGCDYVTFKNLKIQYSGASISYSIVIDIKNASSSNTFDGCKITGFASNANVSASTIYSLSNGGTGNTIKNCTITSGSSGIYYKGVSNASPETGISIFNNTFTNQYDYGMYLYWLYQVQVYNNKISSTSTNTTAGLYLYSCSGDATHYNNVYNNWIQSNGDGINNGSSTYLGVYYNNVNCTGSGTTDYAFYTSGGSGTTLKINNNIFANTGNGYAISATSTNLSSMDYNDYYSTGAYIGDWSGHMARMADWKYNASPFDAHSAGINPQFTSSTDLTVNYAGFANKGIPISGITTDINGTARDGSTPDMGAEEGSGTTHAALNGIYTIGGTTPDYTNIYDASEELNFFGVSGPVTFNIRNGSFTEHIAIGSVSGTSSSNNVIFQSENQDSTLVTLQYTTLLNNAYEHYVLHLLGSSFINFKWMTIKALSTTNQRVIALHGNAHDNKILNNIIQGTSTTGTTDVYALIFDPSTDKTNNYNNEYSYNNIKFGGYGIYSIGLSGTLETGTLISHNILSNQYSDAIHLDYHNAPQINSNKITNTLSPTAAYTGIYVGNTSNAIQIKQNEIYTTTAFGYGIDLESCTGTSGAIAEISNNMIVIGNGNSTSYPTLGILTNVGKYQNIWYNTIRVNSNYVNASQSNSAFKSYNSGNNQVIQNNIFVNKGTGTGALAVAVTATASIQTMDYNDLYTAGTYMGYWLSNSTDNTLASWQAKTPGTQDDNSVSVDPESNYVNSTSDLRLATGNSTLNAGTAVSLTTDIDLISRGNPSTIGASEKGSSCIPVTITDATAAASPICSSATTTLTANGITGTNAVVNWYSSANGVGFLSGPSTTYIAGPGTYYARVTGDCGTGVDAMVTVAPKVNVGITSATAAASPICSSATTTLTANGITGTNAVVNWYSSANGVGFLSGPSTTYIAGPETYYARVTGDCGSAIDAMVTVAEIPGSTTAASINITNDNSCSGVTKTLSPIGGSLGTGGSWNWYSDAGCTNLLSTGNTYDVTPAVSTQYWLRAEGDCGNTATANATVTVKINISFDGIITAGKNPVCSGNTTNLTAGIYTGTGTILQWWTATGGAGGTGSQLGNDNDNPLTGVGAGTYFARVSGDCGSALEASITITNKNNPDVPVITGNAIACPGETLTYSVVENPGETYEWAITGLSNSIQGSNTLSSLDVMIGDGGNLTVTVTNSCGYTNNSKTVNLATIPAAPIAKAGTAITGTSFYANWNGVAGAKKYYLDVATTLSFNGGTFVTNFDGIDVGDVLTKQVTGLTAGTTYYYRVRAEICNSIQQSNNSLTITVYTGCLSASITSQPTGASKCIGQSATFSVVAGGTAPFAYQWYHSYWDVSSGTSTVYKTVYISNASTASYGIGSLNIGDGGEYFCVVKNCSNAGNVTSEKATLTVTDGANITYSPVNATAHVGDDVKYSIINTGLNLIYQWQKAPASTGPWTDISNGGTNPTYINADKIEMTINNVQSSMNNYNFRCVVSDGCGQHLTSAAGTLTISTGTAGLWVGGTAGSLTNWEVGNNWDDGNVPGGLTDVIIPGSVVNMPIINTVAGCHSVTINPRASLYVKNTLNTGGDLVIESNASGTGALMQDDGSSLNIGGYITVKRYMPNAGYHYISSPFETATVNEITNFTPKNIGSGLHYLPEIPWPSGSFPNMWVIDEKHTHDIISDMNSWMPPSTGEIMTPAKGYCIFLTSPTTISFTKAGSDLSLSGSSSSTKYDYFVTKESESTDLYHNGKFVDDFGNSLGSNPKNTPALSAGPTNGWHLVGNPYASPVDVLNSELQSNILSFTSFIAYFKPTSGLTGIYGYYNVFMEKASGAFHPSQYIPSMQSFFIQNGTVMSPPNNPTGAVSSYTLSFKNSMRSIAPAALTGNFYKKESKLEIPSVTLNAFETDNNSLKDEVIIYFNSEASSGNNPRFDATKLMNTDNSVPNIYSIMSEKRFAVKGLPELKDNLKVPIGFGIGTAAKYTINASAINNLPEGVHVYLVDTKTGISQDLTTNASYTFSINNNDESRFYLKFTQQSANSNQLTEICNIYSTNNDLYVNYNNPANSTVVLSIMNMEGQLIRSDVKISNGSYHTTLDVAPGVYFVKVITSRKVYTQKVFIK